MSRPRTSHSAADPHAVPTEPAPRPPRVHASSLLLVHTGNGKGKSTAAFGICVRAVARGWRTRVVQFVKSGDWRTGEAAVLPGLGVEWWEAGDGFSWESDDLDRSQAMARAAWQDTRARLVEDDLDLIVLDEVTYPINWGWLDLGEVVAALRDRHPTTHVVVTGRNCPPRLIELADTVTMMEPVKHVFERGVRARRGIDY